MAWTFDKTIASTFNAHARAHIPDYDRVLDLSVNLCVNRLQKDDPIIEVGCAVGETIKLLNNAGFINLHGVDNSESMLSRCPKDMAVYYNSDTLPNLSLPSKAVLCNWTLHFIKDKVTYLKNIYNSLADDGFLVLSEKTCNEGLALEQYHNFKRSKGVSEDDIINKASSLKDVMFVDRVEWYQETLRNIGFKETIIANSTWCFTTFVALK